jgi:arginyl-tRNA synthetase
LIQCPYISSAAISGSTKNIFINIILDSQSVTKVLNEIFSVVCEFDYRIQEPNNVRVIVDYSSPNIAKEMHVGHLRSTIIGESIRRIFEFNGYKVHGVNHIGDWGTQFGMLIAYLKRTNIDQPCLQEEQVNEVDRKTKYGINPCPWRQDQPCLQEEQVNEVDRNTKYGINPRLWRQDQYQLSDLVVLYKQSKILFDSNDDFKERAHLETVKLQQHDEENLLIWETICRISEEGFQKIYDQLDIQIETKGESFYQSRMIQLVADLKDKLVEEDGMKVLFPTGHKVPLIIQKSDGGFTYDTSDLTALAYRVNEKKVKKIIYVVDMGQQEHFKQLFQAADDLNIISKENLIHAGFGMVLGADGKKLKTRSGETVRLQDLLDDANEHALKITKELAKEKHSDWDTKQIEYVSKMIAINSVKYADLSNPKESNYVFSPQKMMDNRGNTGVYIMYGYARCASILAKVLPLDWANKSFEVTNEPKYYYDMLMSEDIEIQSEPQMILAKKIIQFFDVVKEAEVMLAPHLICDYMYDLITVFNSFYEKERCIELDENKQIVSVDQNRLRLIHLTYLTLAKCMYLVGLEPVEGI